MAVQPPTQLDPFAQPGEWVFVNSEWISVLIGTLSRALYDSYWTGSQDERSAVIQSVMQLINGIGASLPPETVKEIIRIIELESEPDNDNEYENCEVDCMACNCGNSANVRYCEDTGLEYKGSDGIWHPLAVIADGVAPDDETPVGETPPPEVNQNACEKANALWDILYRYMEAIEETVPVFDFDPIPISLEMSQMSAWWVVNMTLQKPAYPMKKIQAALYTLPQWFAANNNDFHDEIDYLQTNVDIIKADFICAMTNGLSKDGKLTDADLEKAYDYEWITGRNHLNNMLGSTLHYFISEDYMKEQAALYVRAAVHVCDCVGNTPVPPPQTEPEAGEFGLYAGEVVGSIATSMTPAGSRTHGTPRGTKVSETKYTAPPYDAGIDQHATIFVMWEATEMLTQVSLEMLWKYTGSNSDGSNQAVWDFKFYYSTGENSNWQLLPGFVGELASNDSDAPGQFFGAVNYQPIPWDSAIMNTDMAFIGVWMRFGIPSDNTLGIIPGGEFTIQQFKAKADSGGNYRASLIPMVFVPKAL